MAETAVEEVILADDPARRLFLAETVGKGFPYMAGTDRYGRQSTSLILWNRCQEHAAVRVILEEHLV